MAHRSVTRLVKRVYATGITAEIIAFVYEIDHQVQVKVTRSKMNRVSLSGLLRQILSIGPVIL